MEQRLNKKRNGSLGCPPPRNEVVRRNHRGRVRKERKRKK